MASSKRAISKAQQQEAARAFAEENADQDVKFPDTINKAMGCGDATIGRVVGYYNNTVVITQYDEVSKLIGLGNTSNGAPVIYTTKSGAPKYISYYRPDQLELVKKKPIQKPYPHKCALCLSPARKMDEVFFCSNEYCKSRKAVKKLFRVNIRKPAHIKCAKCKAKIINSGRVVDDQESWLRKIKCENGHWTRYTLQINDMITDPDRIWNGKWLIVKKPLKSKKKKTNNNDELISNLRDQMGGDVDIIHDNDPDYSFDVMFND